MVQQLLNHLIFFKMMKNLDKVFVHGNKIKVMIGLFELADGFYLSFCQGSLYIKHLLSLS